MKVILDMQGAQTETSSYRGLGRYTMSFAAAVCRNAGPDDEILLAFNAHLPVTADTRRAEFGDLIDDHNIFTWGMLADEESPKLTLTHRREVLEYSRDLAFWRLKPDVVHVTSPFEGGGLVSSRYGRHMRRGLYSATLHDLIPLIYPDTYLVDPFGRAAYFEILGELLSTDVLLSISESSRQEAIRELSLDPARIVTVGSDADAVFRSGLPTASLAAEVLESTGNAGRFVLAPGGNDERKNLNRLVQAFYMMSDEVRRDTYLVIGGFVQDHVVSAIRHVVEEQGGSMSEIVFTGFISDEELRVLYSRCALFIFPSWHEGFGLPALEAMILGAPVLVGDSPGLRDVVGWDAATFDPTSAGEMSALMQRALCDREYSGLLRANSRAQSTAFSWDVTANVALDTWRRLVSHRSDKKER